jgi:hypothetical protein
MNRLPMPIRAWFLGVSAKPNHAAIAALVEAARLSIKRKVFGCKTLQLSHAGRSTLDIQAGGLRPTGPHFPDMPLRVSKYIGTDAAVLVQIVRNW